MKRILLFLVLSTVTLSARATFQLTVAATAIGFRSADTFRANQMFCRLETAEIRYTFDGSLPSATNGFLWEVGEEKTVVNTTNWPQAVQRFQAVRTGSTSGVLDCAISP